MPVAFPAPPPDPRLPTPILNGLCLDHDVLSLLAPITIALAQIRANLGRSLLATLGIVIGIASTLLVIACLTGLQRKVTTEFERFGADNFMIHVQRPDSGPFRNFRFWRLRFKADELDGLLNEAPHLKRVARMAHAYSQVAAGDQQIGLNVQATEPDFFAITRRGVSAGRPLTVADEVSAAHVALVNEEAADRLRLPRPWIGQTLTINGARLTVVGVVEPDPLTAGTLGSLGSDDSFTTAEVFVPFRTLMQLRRRVWIYAHAQADSPADVALAQEEARFFLRRTRRVPAGTPDTFRFDSSSQNIESFNSTTGAVKAIAFGLVSISLLVGGVGIMNIMLVAVSERTREIGLRKAVGATPAALLMQFLIEAAVLCVFGGLIGVLVAQAGIEVARRLPNFPLDYTIIPLWALGLALGFSCSIGLVFGFFPALKAARLDPIAALRHE